MEKQQKRSKSPLIRKKRIPSCQKCGQHGLRAKLKGHKGECPFWECECQKCSVISERQKLMAKQIKIRRQQRKEFGQINQQIKEEDKGFGDVDVDQSKASSCLNFGQQNDDVNPISQQMFPPMDLMNSTLNEEQIVSPIPLNPMMMEFQVKKQPNHPQILQNFFSIPQLPSISNFPFSLSDLQIIQQNLLQLLISKINQ